MVDSNAGSGSDSCVLAQLLADLETSSERDDDIFCCGTLPNSASYSDEGEILEGNSEGSDQIVMKRLKLIHSLLWKF